MSTENMTMELIEYPSAKACWPLTKPNAIEHEGRKYLMCKLDRPYFDIRSHQMVYTSCKARDWLPVEFFSHQLMELDTTKDDEIAEFSARYGIAEYPYRRMMKYVLPLSDTEQAAAIDAKCTQLHCPEVWLGYINLDEERYALRLLQNEVARLFDYIRGETTYPGGYTFCKCSRDSRIIGAFAGTRFSVDDFSLTNAICNQVIEFVTDEAREMKVCPRCGRIFKRHQGSESHLPKTEKKGPRPSVFCSKRCQNAHNQAAFRARKKAEGTK